MFSPGSSLIRSGRRDGRQDPLPRYRVDRCTSSLKSEAQLTCRCVVAPIEWRLRYDVCDAFDS